MFNVTCDGDNVNIEISSHSAKLESFWSGIWLSSWTVSGATLSGNIKAKNHYFEIGNLQLNLNKDYDAITVKNISSADSIIAAISATEDKYLQELEEMYERVSTDIMKKIRRAVPVIGQKFDWDRAPGMIK